MLVTMEQKQVYMVRLVELECCVDSATGSSLCTQVQQNLYAAILQSCYGLKLTSFWLCQLHPDTDEYRFLEVTVDLNVFVTLEFRNVARLVSYRSVAWLVI